MKRISSRTSHVSILAMVFQVNGHDANWGALIVEFFAGAFLAIAGMLKF